MFTEEHLYSIALRRCSLIGDINFYKLVKSVGTAKDVWDISKNQLRGIDGIGKKIIAEIGNPEHLRFAENELQFCEKQEIKINLRHQGGLPMLLGECEDAPAILYQKGNYNRDLITLSIVGTRNITHYGKQFVDNFLSQLRNEGIITVSGLALGTDTEVHEKSLENGIPTIAVLAHGLHTLYPSKNRSLAEKIIENGGALLSEFNSSQKPDRENFIQRNRLIAGLSKATIVVETAFGGGSVSTATFANNYNREVFALPGRITDKYSQGCNQLIYQNKSAAISTIKDLLRDLQIGNASSKNTELFPPSEVPAQLSDNQKTIYNFIKTNPNANLDEISERLQIPTYKLSPVLLDLELSGHIRPLSGKQYRIKE